MQAKTINAATKLAVSTNACVLYRVQGFFKHTANAWLQIHDSAAEPVAGAAPVKSYELSYDAPYSWAFDPASLALRNGCYIALSSDEDAYATIAYSEGTTYLTILADYGPYQHRAADYSVAGDTTTEVYTLTVWADGVYGDENMPKRLLQVDYTNHSGAIAWLMVFARAATTSLGHRPVAIIGGKDGIADGATVSIVFGDGGLSPKEDEGNQLLGDRHVYGDTMAGTYWHNGCYIYESSNAETYIETGVELSHIRAYYK